MVFSYEIPNSPEEAISLAKTTSDGAKADLHTLTKDSYKDSTFITQGLQDNLVLGTADNTRGEGVRLLRSPRTEPLLPLALPPLSTERISMGLETSSLLSVVPENTLL